MKPKAAHNITGFIWILTSLMLMELSGQLSAWAGQFTLDFDDAKDHGALHWGNNSKRPKGKWTLKDGVYVIEATETWAGAFWGKMDWVDYTVSVRARSTSGSGCIAIAVRVQDPSNYYVWAFDVKGNSLAYVRGIDGRFTVITIDPAPGNALDEHIFKVIVSGNQFFGYFDDQLIQKWTDELHASGGVGIGVGCGKGTVAVFDDLVIIGDRVPNRKPDVSPRLVASKGKLTTTWGKIKHVR